MTETGTDSSGRFTEAARVARTRPPKGVSRREGWLILIQALGGGALLSISFQSHAWEWGGIIRFLAQGAFLAMIIMVTGQLAAARGVHPLGHRRRVILAGVLPVLVAAIGGWFWIVPPSHDTPWPVTTAVAILSIVPFAAVGLQLISKGDR